ncbi:MAG: PA domain-containing protein [Chloroflexota bacterium]
MQVLPVKTEFFNGDLLVVNGESCETISNRIGGFSLYDVTDPYHPVTLVENFGDIRRIGNERRANQIHSAFAWGQNGNAYVVTVDDEETTDVDIFDITNPTAPKLIAETGLSIWPAAQDVESDGIGGFRSSFLHDMVVKKIDGHWMMLLSYWDAGYIMLNVDNPAAPVFVNDTSFTHPDQSTVVTEPEGNAHQAEWSHDSQFILGTEEDVSPFRMHLMVNSGPFEGQVFVASSGNAPQQLAESEPLSGPTYFVGNSCSDSLPPKAPSLDAIAVVGGGSCPTDQKVTNIKRAGYAAGILFNSAIPGRCEETVSLIASKGLPLVLVGRSVGFKMLGITDYSPANCTSGTNPSLPPVGTQGSNVTISTQFDGWGAVHLFDTDSFHEIDTYSVIESMDPDYATGFGNLSPHEVAVDSRDNLAYLSYYQAGFRVIEFGEEGIQEVGHFIDANGNNFWGVQVFRLPNDVTTYIAASDRDRGLWVLEYTGP